MGLPPKVGSAPVTPVADPLDDPTWLVWVEGGEVVGPVSARLIARGIRAGRVPTEALVQCVGDVWWSGVLDVPAMIEALKADPGDSS
jgi:hypothetical protein